MSLLSLCAGSVSGALYRYPRAGPEKHHFSLGQCGCELVHRSAGRRDVVHSDDLEGSGDCGFGLEDEPESLLSQAVRELEENMHCGAVDEGDPTQVEEEAGLVPGKRFETRLEVGGVREIELSADADENVVLTLGGLGLQLVRGHAPRRHDLFEIVKSCESARLNQGRRGKADYVVHGDIRTDIPEGFRIAEREHIRGTGTIVLAVRGDADLHGAEELESALAEVIEEGPSVVVVDLSEVTFLDSMVLGVLVQGLKRLRARGGRLRVVAPRAEIRRIFELTLLDRLFDLDSTREEALVATAS
jgi:anti-sigma B factor antagonist